MTKLGIVFLLFFWMLFTLILACSVIGLFVILRRDDWDCKSFQGEEGMAPWMRFGRTLQRELVK